MELIYNEETGEVIPTLDRKTVSKELLLKSFPCESGDAVPYVSSL